jgi:hypothetical protein
MRVNIRRRSVPAARRIDEEIFRRDLPIRVGRKPRRIWLAAPLMSISPRAGFEPRPRANPLAKTSRLLDNVDRLLQIDCIVLDSFQTPLLANQYD